MYDYEAGKQDWLSYGLPVEGEEGDVPRAGEHARPDVPTCSVDERVGDVRDRTRSAGWDASVVVNEERVVFGLLRRDELEGPPDRLVEEAMRPGPSTFRPNVSLMELATLMVDHDMPNIPVTTPDGRLVGLLTLEDAQDVLRKEHERHHGHHEAGP